MHRLLSLGGKLVAKPLPQSCNYIPHFSFASQIDPNFQSVNPFFVARNLYSEDEYKRIQEIQQMSYHTILEEVKKYPQRPKTRVKSALIQFLIEQVPKKGVVSPKTEQIQAEETEEAEDLETPGTSTPKAIHGDIKVAQTIDTEEALKILNEDPLFRSLKQDVGLTKAAFTQRAQKTLPYLENYPEKQLLEQISHLTNVDFKRELEQFIHRSPLYSRTMPLQKVRKLAKEDLLHSFKDMIFVHREYAHLHRNNLKAILTEPKGKLYTTLDCLEALRGLEDPVYLNKMHSYFQTLTYNSLLKFWRIIFEQIEKYDIQTLDLILRISGYLKEKYNISYAEPGNEGVIFERIFAHAVNLVEENNQSYPLVSLTNIINNYRNNQVKLPKSTAQQVQALGKALVKKYNDELLNVEFENLAITEKEMLDISMAVIYSAGAELPTVLPDIFKKLKAAKVGSFEKNSVKNLLIFLSNMKVPASKEIMSDLKDNNKLLDSLNLFDIYLFLYTFRESKIEFSKAYYHLYLAFFSIIEQQNALPDMKNVLLSAKIMNYILENHLAEHRKSTLEKKANYTLMLIERSIDIMEETPQVIDLIEISSLFIPHLNSPDLLFRKILLHLDELTLVNDNKNKIVKFVHKFLDKIEPKYTFNTYLTSTDLEFNDKVSEFTIPIFKKLITKFRESNLLTYIMLNIRIASNASFLKAIYPDHKDRIAFLENLLRQIVGLSSNSTTIAVPQLKIITKFIHANIADLNPNYVVAIHQKLLPHFLSQVKPNSTFNSMLEWIYYVSSSLAYHKKEILNPVNLKHLEALQKKLSEVMTEKVLPAFCENSSLTVSQIIYDKDVSQYFNSSVFNTNFESLEYLLPIMNAINLPITQTIEKNIILQYPRCIKRWHGDLLVKNLLLLDQFKIHCPELFEFSIPNLFSCFTFYFDMQNLVLNKDILDEKIALQLLRAFVNQNEQKYFKEINNSIGQGSFSTNNASLIPLGALLYKTMHLLAPEDIMKIVKILGDERKNYMQAFISKFNHLKFKNLQLKDALDLKVSLPSFLQNEAVNKTVYSAINENKATSDKLFNIMIKEKLWIDDVAKQIKSEIESSKSVSLFYNFLRYLSEAGLHNTDLASLINLTKHLGLSFADMPNEAKVNMLILFYIDQIARGKSREGDEKFAAEHLAFLRPLCRNLLRSEYFHFFENVVTIDGKVHKLKYFGSFELGQDLMSNTFKILPKNRMGSVEAQSLGESENDLFVSQTGATEENLFETSKAFEEQTIRQEYKNIAKKYMLYQQFYDLAELPAVNEQLVTEFSDLQIKNFNLVKFKENFANFLIDITLILHELGLLYKTNLECEQSKVLIDIALIDQMVAIIFIDQQETVCELKGEQKKYHPDNFNKMKTDLLRKAGWNVIPIIYESWNVEFESKEKKEYDIKRRIEEFNSAAAK